MVLIFLDHLFICVPQVIADENYAPGDEVLIRYGKFSNNRLLLDFGFIFPSNKYDKVHVEVDVPQHDHLRAMKLDLLDRHTTPALKDVNELHSSGNCFMVMYVYIFSSFYIVHYCQVIVSGIYVPLYDHFEVM